MTEFTLRELLSALPGCPVEPVPAQWGERIITALACDSRQVEPGALFFALPGAKHDGRAFIGQALERGAAAIVVEAGGDGVKTLCDVPVPLYSAVNVREVLALVSARFHGFPTRRLQSIAVTGTNGKTSVAWLTANALAGLGRNAALVGTLGMSCVPSGSCAAAPEMLKTINTTPDPLAVDSFLASAPHLQSLVMEVTSQGLVQCRTRGMEWDAAIFTNLTRDHLDLHGTLENYESIKTSLFTGDLRGSGKPKKSAILNLDDPAGVRIRDAVNQLDAKIRCIGISVEREDGDIIVRRADCTLGETRIHAAMFGREASIVSRLVGRYNVANLLASSAALVSVGYDADAVSEALKNVPPVPGRLERIGSKDVYVFVDYAHTPDALVNAQRSLRELGSGRLITVFGCGGDRDRGKRPLMGEVVAQMSDYAVVTSDNPRTEEPERIIDDIVPGVLRESGRNGFAWKRIADRREAIAHAIEYARSGDVVLVAGKGHEDYQEIHGVRYEFKDQDVCRGVMANLGIL